MKALAVILALLCAGLSYAHKDEDDVGKKYHTHWDFGKLPNGADSFTHKHPGGSRYDYISRNWHSEFHGGGRGHAAAGEPIGFHYSCVQDDRGIWHNHTNPTNEQLHRKTKWWERSVAGGIGTLDGKCTNDAPAFTGHIHTHAKLDREISDQITPETERQPDSPDTPETSALVMTYEHTFPEGVSLQHIPLDTPIRYADQPFDVLDDSLIWSIANRGVSGWSYYKSQTKRHAGYIGKGIGFVTIMAEEKTIELSGTFDSWTRESNTTYKTLYLRQGGLTLLGVPLRSRFLSTVGDFFNRLDGVISVKGIDPELEIDLTAKQIKIEEDWFVELDPETLIDCCTSYLIKSDGADQYTLWGLPWAYEPPSAAPAIMREGKLSTTWGAIKKGR